MTTEEGNKLIAEFMGAYEEQMHYIAGVISVMHFPEVEDGLICHPLNTLKYNSDWNWIMRVVEKIEKTTKVFIDTDDCLMDLRDYKGKPFPIINECKPSKINAVWFSIIEFIKWYNKNNK